VPEQVVLKLQLEQLPLFDLDPHDAAAARAWRLRSIEHEVSLTGALPLRMVLVGVGVQRIGHLELRLEPKIELEHAALFSMSAAQPDVVRAYREGELTVEEADGRYRAVVTLEYAHATGRWWTARRRVGTNQVAVGVFHGEWVEEEGVGLESLDERLREWVDTTGITLGESSHELTPNPTMPELLCGMATLNGQPPLDAKVFAEIVGNMVDAQLAREYPTGIEVFAFKGREVEHFLVRGQVPFPIDDLVRAIAARGPADAVALRYPGVAEIDGESHRAVFCAVECAGRRHDRVVALKFDQGKPVASRAFHQELGPVGPDGCWLGVQPKNAEVTLFVMGTAGQAVPEG
jgi:hypothetical protein